MLLTHRHTVALLLGLILILILSGPAMGARLPRLAGALAQDLHAQMAERVGGGTMGQGYAMLMATPARLDNLEHTSPLARLMAEELATHFTRNGYRVQEVRQTAALLMKPGVGELGLTRRVHLVHEKATPSALMCTGTYTATHANVRFNIRLIHTASGETLAMSSMTLPLDDEARMLLGADEAGAHAPGFAPTVRTRFPSQGTGIQAIH